MALHDYQCPGCGAEAIDAYRPPGLRARQLRPLCRCGHLMEWVPQIGRMDTFGVNQQFVTPIRQPDGSIRHVTIDSLSTIRRLERESEQRAANGEGAPLRWRDYSHDRNHSLDNSFGPDPAMIAHEEAKGARARFTIERWGEVEPPVALGAGVTESDTSALPALADA